MFVHGAIRQSHTNNNTSWAQVFFITELPKTTKGMPIMLALATISRQPAPNWALNTTRRRAEYWQNFTPAADDVWTSKLGTRGSVYETYAIQELSRYPNWPNGKVFFRLGYRIL